MTKNDDRSIIARLDIGREQIEAIIRNAIVKHIGCASASPDSNANVAVEDATDGILDLLVSADERSR